MARRSKLTDQEREQRREEDRERLQEAARALLNSDGWARWVRVRATNGLARYSVGNQLLIALQRPEATFVAGFKRWLALGYCVRRGERALRILAPSPCASAATATTAPRRPRTKATGAPGWPSRAPRSSTRYLVIGWVASRGTR